MDVPAFRKPMTLSELVQFLSLPTIADLNIIRGALPEHWW
jgi:hypothetical protein